MSDPVVLELTTAVVLRISGDPALYQAAPFLEPMREPALRLHAKYRNVCTNCAKEAKAKAFGAIACAMTSLLVEESRKAPNLLGAFKETVGKLLKMHLDQVSVRYQKDGEAAELRF